eukprot:Selendium_serpulae@DN9076_c0_g1_i1.p1
MDPTGSVRSKKPPDRGAARLTPGPPPSPPTPSAREKLSMEASVAAMEYERLRQAGVLESAEELVNQQRQQIQELIGHLESSDRARDNLVACHKEEALALVEENKHLRMKVDHLNADIAAASFRAFESEKLNQTVTEELATSERLIAQRNKETRDITAQLGHLPVEVNKLSAANQELKADAEHWKQESIRLGSSSIKDQTLLEDRLTDLKRDLECQKTISQELNARAEEERVAKRCLVQLEADLLESQII